MSVNNKNNQITTFTLPVAQTQSTDFAKRIKHYLFYWPWFILSLALFGAGAYFLIKNATPIYPITASLEFKNSKGVTNYSSEKKSLQELDQISTPIVFQNEIEVIRSKKIMLQVVNSLKLWVSYSKKDGMSTRDLYNASPLNFQFINTPAWIDSKGILLAIIIKDSDSFIVKDKDDKQTLFKYGQYIKSDFGLWKLDKTALINNYLGANIQIKVGNPSLIADGYVAGIKTNFEDKEVPFVTVTFSDIVPKRGVDILNQVIKTYIQSGVDEKNKKTQATIAFLTKRIDSIGKDLHANESQIENYEVKQGLTDIASQSQSYVQDKQANTRSLNDINIQIRIINNIERYINSAQDIDKQPSTQGLQDQGLNYLMEKLSELQLQKQNLLATNPKDNPVFGPLNNQIKNIQEKIREKIRTNKETLLLTKNQLESYGSKSEGQIRNVPTQATRYAGMKRDKDVEERLYTILLDQREQLSLNIASTVSDAQVVDDARAGAATWPKPVLFYMFAVALGLLVPVGVIYGVDSLDFNKITNPKQIEDALGLPILGELSFQKSTSPLVITQGKENNAIGEQFRLLRTNLSYLYNNIEGRDNTKGRVTLFTSSTAGEGKSFVSSNLAMTLAYSTKKTIILEMDLRKPKVVSMFNLSAEHLGVSNYLSGENVRIEDLIQHTDVAGLDIINCGTIDINPSELLEREQLGELIARLRTMYNHIIIDTPPVHLVTDALIIAQHVDVSLYVIRQGYTQKDELDFIKVTNLAERLPQLNIVFNGIKRVKYGYGYNYDTGYYVNK